MGKSKIGRPTVMTQEIIDKLEHAFSFGASDKEACLYADISPATLYKHQEANPDFTERKLLLKQRPVLEARQTVVKGIKKDAQLALKFLERKRKKEFSLRTEHEHEIKELPRPILGGMSGQDVSSDDSNEKISDITEKD